jgi:hypothetical protein
MKHIIIKGKHQQEKIANIHNPKRSSTQKLDLSDNEIIFTKQIEYVNKLYLEEDYIYAKFIKRELNNKLMSYKKQDIDNNKLNVDKLITYDKTLELLVASKLKCKYCHCKMYVLYDNVRQKDQWTLDRIDNDYGHNNDNVLIACLECNIKRRRMNMDRFQLSKDCINIKKIE